MFQVRTLRVTGYDFVGLYGMILRDYSSYFVVVFVSTVNTLPHQSSFECVIQL